MIDPNTLFIEEWETKQSIEFAQAVTGLRVNYSISGSAELTVDVADYRMLFWDNNYFQIGTTVIFKNERFRIASTELSQGDGEYVNVKLQIRTEAVQLMKENRTPQAFRSATGFEFARQVAKTYNLIPIIQEIKGVKQSVIKVKVKDNRESVWDVLQRAASDIQYVCFVSDGRLIFASPQWLLGRWGLETIQGATLEGYGGKKVVRDLSYVPFIYPADRSYSLFLLELPNMRRSEDSPREAEGSVQLWAGDAYEQAVGTAYNLRAGMTGYVYGIKGFEQAYLITSIDYQYAVSEPIEVALATVSKLFPQDASKINEKIAETVVIGGGGE